MRVEGESELSSLSPNKQSRDRLVYLVIEISGLRLQMPSSNDVKSVKSTGVLIM
jgi:hypothetical protein